MRRPRPDRREWRLPCSWHGVEALEDRRLLAATPELVAELNPGSLGAKPSGVNPSPWLENTGSRVFYTANNPEYGDEVWTSDGTAAGTRLIADLDPAADPQWLGQAHTTGNGLLFFQRGNTSNGPWHLVRSDGTPAGTFNLITLSNPRPMTFWNGRLYFVGEDNKTLWSSDGTVAGTQQVVAHASAVTGLVAAGNVLVYNVANTLHKFDGTTHTPLSTFASIDTLFGADGYVLLRQSGNHSLQILNTTTGALQLVSAATSPSGFTKLSGGRVGFLAAGRNWVTDGTAANTLAIRSVAGTLTNSLGAAFAELNGELYFSAREAGTSGEELWKVPAGATSSQAVRVIDLRPGSEGSFPLRFITHDGAVYFNAYTPEVGIELYRTDGTAAGTRLVADLAPGAAYSSPEARTVLGGKLLFLATGSTYGWELYSTTTGAGASLVADVNATPLGATFHSASAAVGDTLFFAADDVARGVGAELWASDGTAARTRLVKDILLGNNGSTPRLLTAYKGRAYFAASAPAGTSQLWQSDGTDAGTVPLGAIASHVTGLTVSGANLFVATLNGGLWRWDGATLDEVRPDDRRLDGVQFGADVGGTYYFTANDGVSGTEVWRSDGASSGTQLVADLAAGSASSTFRSSVVLNSRYMFVRGDGFASDVWSTDGTADGTLNLIRVDGGTSGFSASLYVAGNLAYVAHAPYGQLFRSDGTAAGTYMLANVAAYTLNHLAGVGDTLYFSAGPSVYGPPSNAGVELWKTNGRVDGTTRVKDIHPNGDSLPSGLTAVNGRLYFMAATPAGGREPWVSDGTAGGTQMLGDLAPGGTAHSDPQFLGGMGGDAYFAATGTQHGRELWRVAAPPPPADPAPRVNGVYLNGTAWTAAYRTAMQSGRAGDATFGFRIDPAQQTALLPWTNLNVVSVRFSEHVNVAADDLVVRGVNVAAYGLAAAGGFAYDPATFTATWTLAGAIGADKVLLDLDAAAGAGVTDATGNALDGEWTNPAAPTVSTDPFPSGDGVAGGDFRYRLNVLPGDVNRNGSVQGNDVTLVRNAQGATPGGALYTIFKDVNGNAGIQGNDVTLVRNRQGFTLPTEEPAAPLRDDEESAERERVVDHLL